MGILTDVSPEHTNTLLISQVLGTKDSILLQYPRYNCVKVCLMNQRGQAFLKMSHSYKQFINCLCIICCLYNHDFITYCLNFCADLYLPLFCLASGKDQPVMDRASCLFNIKVKIIVLSCVISQNVQQKVLLKCSLTKHDRTKLQFPTTIWFFQYLLLHTKMFYMCNKNTTVTDLRNHVLTKYSGRITTVPILLTKQNVWDVRMV